jgi:hypothetical protein
MRGSVPVFYLGTDYFVSSLRSCVNPRHLKKRHERDTCASKVHSFIRFISRAPSKRLTWSRYLTKKRSRFRCMLTMIQLSLFADESKYNRKSPCHIWIALVWLFVFTQTSPNRAMVCSFHAFLALCSLDSSSLTFMFLLVTKLSCQYQQR